LRGGGWLATHAVTVEDRAGAVHRLVIRRWARPGWELEDPDATPAAEAALLERLAVVAPRLPVPRVVAVDPDGSRAGVPALLATRLPGRPPPRARVGSVPALRTLVEWLVEIESVGDAVRDVVKPYSPYYRVEDLAPPPASTRPELWRRAFDAAAGSPASSRTTFIHRDYHPGNTLWRGATLTGIVDWTPACWGPPGADVGHLLANIGFDHGPGKADTAARLWSAAGGETTDLAWWRLRSFLDFIPDAVPPGDPPALAAAEANLEALLQGT
jgi:aminoglycoside phosphotransferase (APT) family kinase protein